MTDSPFTFKWVDDTGADDPSYIVDLVKRHCCHEWTETPWELSVEEGYAGFACARCGLPPHPELLDFVRDYLYSGVLARVRLGPVEYRTAGAWDAPETEPDGVPVRPWKDGS